MTEHLEIRAVVTKQQKAEIESYCEEIGLRPSNFFKYVVLRELKRLKSNSAEDLLQD